MKGEGKRDLAYLLSDERRRKKKIWLIFSLMKGEGR
jgi:hypothetical protein